MGSQTRNSAFGRGPPTRNDALGTPSPVPPVWSSAFTRVKTVRPVFEILRLRAMEPAAPEDRQTRLKAELRTGLSTPLLGRPNPRLAPSTESRPRRPCKGSLPLWASSMVRRRLHRSRHVDPPRVRWWFPRRNPPTWRGEETTTRFVVPTCRWPQGGRLPPRFEVEAGRYETKGINYAHDLSI